MSRLAAFTPISTADVKPDPESPGFFSNTASGLANDGLTATWFNSLIHGFSTEYDPNFRLSAADVKRLGEGLPTNLLPRFAEARSMDEAMYIRNEALATAEHRRNVAAAGWSGVGATMASTILDPATLAATLATEGMVPAAMLGTGRVAALTRTGIVGGVSIGAAEEARASLDASVSQRDVMHAALGAAITGGLLHVPFSFAGEAMSKALRAVQKDVEYADVGYAMGAAGNRELSGSARDVLEKYTITKDGQRYFREQIGDAPVDGPGTLYHGTGKADLTAEQLDPFIGSHESLFGHGIYMTDSPDIAEGYAKARSKKTGTPTVYAAKLDIAPERILDLEKPITPDVAKIIERGPAYDELKQVVRDEAAKPGATTEDVMLALRKATGDYSHENQIPTSEFVEQYQIIAEDLNRELGYDALTHTGGKRTGNAPHRVMIVLDPKKVSEFAPRVVPDKVNPASVVEQLIRAQGLDPVEDAAEIAALREAEPDIALQRFLNPKAEPVDPSFAHGGGDVPPSTPTTPLAEGETPPPPKRQGDFFLDGLNSARAAYGPVRFSVMGRVGNSASAFVRKTINALLPDALAKADGSPSLEAAYEWVRRKHMAYLSQYETAFQDNFAKYAEANNIPWLKRPAAMDAFDEMVGKAVRREPGAFTQDPFVNAVADTQRALQASLLDLAKRHGVKGFENVDPKATYLTRFWQPRQVDAAIARYGEDQVRATFADAIKARSENLTDEQAEKIARGFIRTIRNLDNLDTNTARFLSDQPEALAEELRRIGLTDQQVEDVLYVTKPRDPASGTPSRAKRRLDLDETSHSLVRNLETGETERLAMEDMMQPSARQLFHTYSRQMTGHSAMAEVFRALSTPDREFTTFQQVLNAAKSEMQAVGETNIEGPGGTLSKLDRAYRAVAGYRMNPNTGYGQALRMLRTFNYLNLGGQFGIAQVPQVGNVISQGGFKILTKQLPALGEIMRGFEAGKANNALLNELDAALAAGNDRLTHQIIGRLDQSATAWDKLGRGLDRTASVAGDLSLLHPINARLQRMAALAAVQNFTDNAFTGTLPNAARLGQLGLDKAMAERISSQIVKHAETVEGTFGRSIRRANIDAWNDTEAASRFIAGIDKWSRRSIHDNDPGALANWMTSDLGKTLIQFRVFHVQAYEKQLLARVQTRDLEAMGGIMWATLVGGLTYVGQQYVSSFSKDKAERADFLAEKLAPDRIGAAAFARNGAASMAPMVYDTFQHYTGGNAFFGDNRYSGLKNEISLDSNPTSSLLFTTIPKAASGVGAAARGFVGLPGRKDRTGDPDPFTQKDAKALFQMIPFRNVLGAKTAIDKLIDAFPEDK